VFQHLPLAVSRCRSPGRPATVETKEFPDPAVARQHYSQRYHTTREQVRIDLRNQSFCLLNSIYLELCIRVFDLHRQPHPADVHRGRFGWCCLPRYDPCRWRRVAELHRSRGDPPTPPAVESAFSHQRRHSVVPAVFTGRRDGGTNGHLSDNRTRTTIVCGILDRPWRESVVPTCPSAYRDVGPAPSLDQRSHRLPSFPGPRPSFAVLTTFGLAIAATTVVERPQFGCATDTSHLST